MPSARGTDVRSRLSHGKNSSNLSVLNLDLTSKLVVSLANWETTSSRQKSSPIVQLQNIDTTADPLALVKPAGR